MSDCIFCKIKNNEIHVNKVGENKHAIAFLDAYPITYGHCLVIPKEHYENLSSCESQEVLHDVIDLTKAIADKLKNLNVGIQGFNYLSNEKPIAGQMVMHFHMHIIPKYDEQTGFKFAAQKPDEDPLLEAKIRSLIIN